MQSGRAKSIPPRAGMRSGWANWLPPRGGVRSAWPEAVPALLDRLGLRLLLLGRVRPVGDHLVDLLLRESVDLPLALEAGKRDLCHLSERRLHATGLLEIG